MAVEDDLENILNTLKNIDLGAHRDEITQKAQELHDRTRGTNADEDAYDDEPSQVEDLLGEISDEAELIIRETSDLERFFATG